MYRNAEEPQIVQISPFRIRGGSFDDNIPADFDVEIILPNKDQDVIEEECQATSTTNKIGMRSLQKFEKKEKQLQPAIPQKRRLLPFHNPININTLLNTITQYSIQ